MSIPMNIVAEKDHRYVPDMFPPNLKLVGYHERASRIGVFE